MIVMVMVSVDLLWLGAIAKPIYQHGTGHLMADKPNVPVVVLVLDNCPSACR